MTSTWLTEPHKPEATLAQITEEQRIEYARLDIEDIRRADAMIFFSVDETVPTVRGGRHVEFGYALGLGKPIFVIGPKENIFHYLPTVRQFETWHDFKSEVLYPFGNSVPDATGYSGHA